MPARGARRRDCTRGRRPNQPRLHEQLAAKEGPADCPIDGAPLILVVPRPKPDLWFCLYGLTVMTSSWE
jgi:hypothetical protein